MYAASISLPRSHYGTTETLVCRSALKTKTKKITALGEKTQKNINCKTPRPDSGRSGDCPQSNGGSSAFVQRVLPPSHSGSKHRRGGPSKHADMISMIDSRVLPPSHSGSKHHWWEGLRNTSARTLRTHHRVFPPSHSGSKHRWCRAFYHIVHMSP
jgi:hypothetical protein